ncbi:RHS repeat-associated core domain-containing protein [Acidovorax sp. SUPP3334]|uniref:RHS repeat-associated core domain-containing protein n=1 Tax=Acidovorax sp. SUPP3334 TaxID=2920881 RepID=UPI0024E0814B|nr:RHS repeat-associated core domain-containing protein [Acidovorax sp. SUPP3334]
MGKLVVSGASLPDGSGKADAAQRVQNAQGLIDSETDFRGVVKTKQWDFSRQLPISTTEAAGTAQARTTSTEWHPQWRLPVKVTEAGRETSYTYDSLGNALTQTIKDTSVTPAVSRTWTWTYHPTGLVASETEPNGAVSSFTYDSAGNLTQATNALGQSSLYTHDAAGRVLTHTAPTGLVSTYQYDLRGRLTRVQRGDEATVFTYRPTGQVVTASTPAGYQITYTYDAAQRLTGWSDNRGASASYTLDGMGNRINESITDAQGQAAWTVARTINSLNRVESVTIGSAATGTLSTTGYGYDANGDLIRSTETVGGASRSTTLGLDALRRVKTITNAQNASAALVYNAQDAVTQATDFKSVATSYARDALGNARQEASADSGTLTSSYDSLGLPQSITDALGSASAITRDALGRPTQIVSSQGGVSRTTVLRYDLPGAQYNASGSASASVGYLSEIQDAGVTTRYQRDAQGRITERTQVLSNGTSSTVGYQYVPAGTGNAGAGQIARITYASGRQLVHQYDATGQLTGLQWNGQPLVSGITWSPLGQATGWQWPGFAQTPGNPAPLAEQRSYTSAGQLAASALLQLTWDSAGRIAQITQQHMLPAAGSTTVAQQVPLTSAYSYDTVGRLTASAHSAPGTLTLPSAAALSDTIGANASGYAWDANGNRSQSYYSSSTAGGTATLQRDYQIASDSNRLGGYTQTFTPAGGSAQTSAVAYNHDATGSITRKGDSYLHYGVDGRIAKAGPSADPANALAVSYTYNALGQRVFKSDARLSGSNNPAITQQTVYAEDGIGSTVLGQYGSRRSSDSAAPAGEMDSTEVIYLPTAAGPMPIAAQINGRLYAIDADHLNTPRRLTNTQGQVAWQWLITGFGEANPTTGATGYTQSGQGSAAYAEAIRFDLRYPGQVFDEETGLNYNLHRSYDMPSGRYIQNDPIGLNGGWNRYGYVGGNPLNFTDPTGLQAIPLPPLLIPGVPNPSVDAQRDLADRLSRAFKDDDETTYQTYTRYNPLTGDCYSGRTSGIDTPERNVRNRGYGQSLLNAEGFLPPVLDRSSTNYDAIRGREQQLIDINGGAQSSGGDSRNKINGISPWNPRGPLRYIPAANAEFGRPVASGHCTCQ